MEIRKYATLLSVPDLFDMISIDNNVDTNLLEPCINEAQEIRIQEYLGSNLYNKIMAGLVDSNLGSSYEALLYDYITPCLAQWAKYYAYDTLNYRLTNKSVAEKTSDNSNPADLKTVIYNKEEVKNKAEFLGKRLIRAICEHKEDFPEYYDYNEDLKPAKTSYQAGVYLGPDYHVGDCGCSGNSGCY